MAVRPVDIRSKALTKTYKVATSQTVTKGMGVIFASADTDIQVAGANGIAIGIALESGVAGDKINVALFGHAIVTVLVGTGGATRGLYAVAVSDGYANQTLGGGTTVKYIAGQFLQTGVATEHVGMLVGGFASGSA